MRHFENDEDEKEGRGREVKERGKDDVEICASGSEAKRVLGNFKDLKGFELRKGTGLGFACASLEGFEGVLELICYFA